eukprot:13318117-Alexandrium_andersonii.AAC.1
MCIRDSPRGACWWGPGVGAPFHIYSSKVGNSAAGRCEHFRTASSSVLHSSLGVYRPPPQRRLLAGSW